MCLPLNRLGGFSQLNKQYCFKEHAESIGKVIHIYIFVKYFRFFYCMSA